MPTDPRESTKQFYSLKSERTESGVKLFKRLCSYGIDSAGLDRLLKEWSNLGNPRKFWSYHKVKKFLGLLSMNRCRRPDPLITVIYIMLFFHASFFHSFHFAPPDHGSTSNCLVNLLLFNTNCVN